MYSGALLGVISRIIPQIEVAEDILQETFIKIWNSADSYDNTKGRLFTWMMNVARNAAIDKIRSRGYQDSLKNKPIPDNNDSITGELGVLPKVDDVGLRKVLSTLKEDHRVLIELSYYQGFTHDEISKQLDIPLGTVKTRIRSALSHLRTLIK